MQYYIKLSSANSFHKIQTIRSHLEADSASVSTMNEAQSTSSGDITGENSGQRRQATSGSSRRREKTERGVKFIAQNKTTTTTTTTKPLNPIMEIKSDADQKTNSKPISEPSEHQHKASTAATDEHEGREFDVVIFAASGCVGKFLVEELALVVDKHLSGASMQAGSSTGFASPQEQFAQQALRRRSVPSSSRNELGLKWAVAGRSAVRLSETLCRAELSTGIKNLSKAIPVLLADLNQPKSLADMCQKARLVINCAGPYSELGAELLIKSCIESRTHYVDLAHEVTFVELMRQQYSRCARDAGVFILNGCAFQSMSAEMGLNFTKQVADGTIEQVKIILSMSDTSALVGSPSGRQRASGIVSEGMWNSLLAEKAQEVSLEERLRLQVADREQLAYQQLQEQQLADERAAGSEADKVDKSDANGQAASASVSLASLRRRASTSAASAAQLIDGLSSQTRSLASRILERKDTQSLVRDLVQFRNRSARPLAWPLRLIQGFQGRSGRGFCWPIDNIATDEAQLIRTEMSNYELRGPELDADQGWRPIRCSTFLSVKSFTQLAILFIWLFLFQLLVKFSLFRYAMRKLPQLITLGHVASSSSACSPAALACGASNGSGPSQGSGAGGSSTLERHSLSHIKFCQTFIAYGTPSDESADPLERRDPHAGRKQVQLLVSRVVGPEPIHVATATLAIQAALTVLSERDHLPCQGGVLTPGAAFAETNIIYQLRKRNIKFEVLKKA